MQYEQEQMTTRGGPSKAKAQCGLASGGRSGSGIGQAGAEMAIMNVMQLQIISMELGEQETETARIEKVKGDHAEAYMVTRRRRNLK